jgi:hypothetical protein
MSRKLITMAVLALVLTAASAAHAGTVTISSTTNSNYFDGYLNPTATLATFDFSGSPGLSSLQTIDSVSISFWMYDGDSASGEFDHDDLVLLLDGYDTGLELNGYSNNDWDYRTSSGAPNNASAILGALKADDTLVAKIKDLDLSDGNGIKLKSYKYATLEITGGSYMVPLPAAAPLGLALMGGLGLLSWIRRRRRTA